MIIRKISLSLFCLSLAVSACAEISLPNVFGDYMVLQRDQHNRIWGLANPGESVSVQFAGQTARVLADSSGQWELLLDPVPAGGPHELVVSGENELRFNDVLVGEVWVCSGQSNMEWPMNQSDQGDLYLLAGDQPKIRLLTIPKNGTPIPQNDTEGTWTQCTAEALKDFSAVGYYFGLRLQQTLGVPVGLIDNSWGGSPAEAWVPKEALKASGKYNTMIEVSEAEAATYSDELHEQNLAKWREWKRDGRPEPGMRWPSDARTGNRRPANLYNGQVHPIVGYGIRGVIWYQGESNGNRGYQYRHLFQLLITSWRERWQQGDFSFYWVQLADYKMEAAQPTESDWPKVREAQTMALDLPNTGQVVAIDLGEGRDIHPRDKLTVGNRLARIALARDYGFSIDYESPRFGSMQRSGADIIITFDYVSESGLWAFDTEQVFGFAIAGKDKKFVWANAEILSRNKVRVFNADVEAPVAVRYGWEMNPVLNLFDRNGLPVTPFRTDDW